jgi:predicted HicB family RNase H-like nuclease
MKITLSIDERVAEQARQAAMAMGKSLNQAVRDYLEQLAGRLRGWKFNRDELQRRA